MLSSIETERVLQGIHIDFSEERVLNGCISVLKWTRIRCLLEGSDIPALDRVLSIVAMFVY